MKKLSLLALFLVMLFTLSSFSSIVLDFRFDSDLDVVESPISDITFLSTTSEIYGAAWEFPEHTSEIIDSYSSFIFRTKKSAEVEELRVVLNVNPKGKISGYKVLNKDADKGLVERMGYVLRQIPRPMPVPGFDNYDAAEFLLIIKK
ncbi:hypothetical protein [Arthrospiribacter ruber]|uniref:TonB C-terminal domain-containing protein n=1 Tax=Arthrospiribacter ruber TaxID=2487934 RepID=A0A951M8K5_9BACT|nr:hypothetical protein [Arthrospiribacter ruber]MBW3467261.1 hypothetical protein [Arthrospiribacter ruber]